MGCKAFVSCRGCRSTWRLGRLEDSRTPQDILPQCCRPAERRNHGCAGKKATGKDLCPEPARTSGVPTAEERLAALSLARDLTAADRKNTFKICRTNKKCVISDYLAVKPTLDRLLVLAGLSWSSSPPSPYKLIPTRCPKLFFLLFPAKSGCFY